MGILHIVIFRMKWKTRELWINILKKLWKWIGIGLLIALVIAIINIIYGKLQYSKIPEVDESIFYRSNHQIPLPDDEDALIQLRKLDEEAMSFNWVVAKNEVWKNLGEIYKTYKWQRWMRIDNPYRDSKIWWEWNQDECIKVYSWDIESCGTWVWNKNTLDRFFNRYYDKITENWENINITIREYLDKNESQIKADLDELDRILSMNYYLPNDKLLFLLPNHLQNYSRGMSVILLYYTQKEDWDMVRYIVEINQKITDLFNNIWAAISIFIWSTNENIINETLNSAMKIFPEDLRRDLAIFYMKNTPERNELIQNMIKWEYALFNEQIRYVNESNEISSYFPFYSESDTKRAALYAYKLLSIGDTELYSHIFRNNINSEDSYIQWLWNSLYNIYWRSLVLDIIPAPHGADERIDLTLSQRQALITNLRSWDYDAWFNEKARNNNPDNYETYQLPTSEELAD